MNYKLLDRSDFESWLNIRLRKEVPFTKEEIIKLRDIFDSTNFIEVKNRSFIKRIKHFFIKEKLSVIKAVDKTITNISITKFDDEWFLVNVGYFFHRYILCDQFDELVQLFGNIDHILEDIQSDINKFFSRGVTDIGDFWFPAPATPNAYIRIDNHEISDTNT